MLAEDFFFCLGWNLMQTRERNIQTKRGRYLSIECCATCNWACKLKQQTEKKKTKQSSQYHPRDFLKMQQQRKNCKILPFRQGKVCKKKKIHTETKTSLTIRSATPFPLGNERFFFFRVDQKVRKEGKIIFFFLCFKWTIVRPETSVRGENFVKFFVSICWGKGDNFFFWKKMDNDYLFVEIDFFFCENNIIVLSCARWANKKFVTRMNKRG